MCSIVCDYIKKQQLTHKNEEQKNPHITPTKKDQRATTAETPCLNLKKVDTFGSNTKSKNETKDTDTSGVQ